MARLKPCKIGDCIIPPASWIIVDIKTGKAVMETYDKATADKAAGTGHYRAVPALEYLQAINARIKAAGQ